MNSFKRQAYATETGIAGNTTPNSYMHTMTDTVSTSSEACQLINDPITVYTNVPLESIDVGTFIYIDSQLSTLYIGTSEWNKLNPSPSIQINNSGRIDAIFNCGV